MLAMIVLFVGLLIGLTMAPQSALADGPVVIERVSVSSSGIEGNASSGWPHGRPAISADGRWVAFESSASNLVPGDTNGCADVFVRDCQTGVTQRVSISAWGAEGSGCSGDPSISADGRYVAFGSAASNLVSADTNGVEDVFVHDRTTGTVTRVSVASDGMQADAACRYPAISADGRYVAFESFAGNLVPGDTNGYFDVFVHDRDADGDGIYDEPGDVSTTRVSVASDGSQAQAMETYTYGQTAISADGRYVAFVSWSRNLADFGENPYHQVLIHDRQTGLTTCASTSSLGTPGNGSSGWPSLSEDGRYLAFDTLATNLLGTANQGGVFVKDLVTGEIWAVAARVAGQGGGSRPSISSDGRHVAFESTASTLVSGDANSVTDVFVYDRADGSLVRVSQTASGEEGNGHSTHAALSADGQRVAFHSEADNLVSGDTNGVWDVFVAATGGRVDLGVERVAMVQVVEGVDDLVAGKPLAVVATVRSTGAVSAPVTVHADYGGQRYDRFYVLEAGNVDQDFRLLDDSAALTFSEAGVKILYFFPDEPPVGSYALATVTVDGGEGVAERDASNNSRACLQPVFETAWEAASTPLRVLHEFALPAGQLTSSSKVALAWKYSRGLSNHLSVLPLANADYAADLAWLSSVAPDASAWYDALLDLRRGLALARPGYARYVIPLPEEWWGEETSCGIAGTIPPLAEFGWRALMLLPWSGTEALAQSADRVGASAAILSQGEGAEWRALAALSATYDWRVPEAGAIPVTGGLDVVGRRVLDDTFAKSVGRRVVSFAGLLVPGDDVWVDSDTYATLIGAARSVSEVPSSGEPVLVVSGTVSGEGGALGPCYVCPSGIADEMSDGEYSVACLDDRGAALAQREFNVRRGLTGEGGLGQSDQASFAVVLPYPPDTTEVVLRRGDRVLATRRRTSHAPSVTVTFPNGGESLEGPQKVTWTASDLDGDALTYSVFYSADRGTTWDTLGLDLLETWYEWDTNRAPGGVQTCLVRVVASDGINTSEDRSDAPFSVANKLPSVAITAPTEGAVCAQGTSVHLQGAALDPEDGWLSGASLVWTSDRDGYLGSGQDLSVPLSLGEHVVTLTATDASGAVAAVQRALSVPEVVTFDVSIDAEGVLQATNPTTYRLGWLGARVRAVGRDATVVAQFYDGDPNEGGQLIGSRTANLSANTDEVIGAPWMPSVAGDHAIHVVVSSQDMAESSLSNNATAGNVCVAEAGQSPVLLPFVLRGP